jgi:predicted nucleic acid-binding protein
MIVPDVNLLVYAYLLENLAAGSSIGANLMMDAHLAALAIEHQAELHSNDTDFSRFSGLRWRNPIA